MHSPYESSNTDKPQDKDTGYSKSSAPSISMPKGGGAMKGIDEKFSVNAVNGTSGMTIPIPSLKTRSDFAPGLTLSYSSGGGNSEFGLGWGLSLPSIQRKTDKQLPKYNDAEESDVFLFAGAEDLIPVDGSETTPSGFRVKRYRPRVEGLFARIEKIRPTGASYFYWKVTTKDNLTTFFGLSDESRLSDPDEPTGTRIYKWLPDFSFDDKGNYHVFEYKLEDLVNVPKHVHEQHRHKVLQNCTNIYLKTIKYGNHIPFYLTEVDAYAPAIPSGACFYTTVFDYGEHDEAEPGLTEVVDWPCRKDPFSDYHAGFEIRIYRLCKRVLCFSHFDELTGGTDFDTAFLVSSLDLTYKYEDSTEELLETDYIIAATQKMYRWNEGTSEYTPKALPAMLFTYQEVEWDTSIHNISRENLVNAPTGLSSGYQWIDFYGEGISGILTEQAEGWYYKTNWGDGTFSPAQKIAPKPNFTGLQLQDLDADGKKYAVSNMPGTQGYFELDDDNKWQNFRAFKNTANIDFNDPNTRMLDLNGDGMPDILISQERVFTYYEAKGTEGYDGPKTAPHPLDENKGAAIVFSDSTQSIYLADMSGDGMTDIVRIRNKDICYWPNLGYGRFGAKVIMSNAPLMDKVDQFNPAYIHLSDISGTGASDLIYLGKHQFRAWLNLSGNGWSEVQEISPFPHTEQPNTLSVVDLLGNGTSCLVWSSSLPQYATAPMRYIDLMGGKKPYLLKKYENSAGKEVTLTYKSSTHYYLEDKKKGKPWITKLPFPVHCVQKTETKDVVTGNTYCNLYTYHHGYYDHAEREFRGFGRVETKDTETFINPNPTEEEEDLILDEPPILTKTWYHTGAWIRQDKILNHYKDEYFNPALWNGNTFTEHDLVQPALPAAWTAIEQREALRALKSVPLRQEVYALDETDKEKFPYSATEYNYDIQLLQAKGDHRFAVFLVHEKENIAYNYERNAADPRIAHSLNIVIDEYANIVESATVVYARVTAPSLPSIVTAEQEKIHVIYTLNEYTNDVNEVNAYRLRLPYYTRQFELTGCILTADYFTIDDLKDDFDTATEIDYVDTISTGLEKRLIEAQKTIFLEDDATTILTEGIIQSKAIPYQAYRLAFTEDLLTDVYGAKVNINDMVEDEGKYLEEEYLLNGTTAKNYYWIPSGTIDYGSDPADTFYLPVSASDPWGNTTTLEYYGTYYLMLQRTIDALGNTTTIEEYEWRTLQPRKMLDINENRTVMAYDILGMPTGMAVLGKGNYFFDTDNTDGSQGDGLDHFVADLNDTELDDFFEHPLDHAEGLLQHATARYIYDYRSWPLKVATITREKHYYAPLSEGGAEENAPGFGTDGGGLLLAFEYSDGLGRLQMKKAQAEPEAGTTDIRWIGSGRTILNNKSKPIKQYEPYFSTTHEYETDTDIIEVGYSPVIYYDPVGRVIRTDMPDGTYSKVVFDAWMQTTYDANDNVDDSAWKTEMAGGTTEEQDALTKTQAHADTPIVVHTDSLARPFYTIQHNKVWDAVNSEWDDEFIESYVILDIEGNTKLVIDGRGLTQFEYKHDMLGNLIYQQSIDSGERWMLNNVFGKPMYGWDSMDQIAHNLYDDLHRPTEGYIDDRQISKIEYGEGETDAELQNFRGQAIRTWDSAGLQEALVINFKGQPLQTKLTLIEDPEIMDIDWLPSPSLSTTDIFETTIVYDALGRSLEQVDPGGNITENTYSEGGLLKTVTLNSVDYVTDIIHNAKGQREHIYYGNDTKTRYYYNLKNYRVNRILTTRNIGSETLQDLRYTYDAVGNITTMYNHALETIFFDNQEVEPKQTFTYDAIYRLIEATGRETFNGQDDEDDTNAFTPYSVNFGYNNPNELTNYTQYYTYDKVGNILELNHVSGGANSYTRTYDYDSSTNRLAVTTIINTISYDYDAHGNLLNLSNLSDMNWNALDQLSYIEKGSSLRAYYQYSGGNRIRKTILKSTGETEQRIYLGNYEIYRKFDSSSLILKRETVHISDDTGRFAMLEHRLEGEDEAPEELVRYIYSNHLQSATLELDEEGEVISYEEYHPYGTTSYHAKSEAINAVAKRYRYTGKERDEESGLYYHGARYYIPWLCRWSAVDPLESKYKCWSSYNYCICNPIIYRDDNGKDIIVFIETTTINKRIFSGADTRKELVSKNTSMSYLILKAEGEDRFFYQKNEKTNTSEQRYDYKSGKSTFFNSSTPENVKSTKEFFPLRKDILSPSASGGIATGPKYSSGITRTEVGFGIGAWDGDYTSLAKLSPEPLRKHLESKNPMFSYLTGYKQNYNLGMGLLIAYQIADLSVMISPSILKVWEEAKLINALERISAVRGSLGVSKTKNIAIGEGIVDGETLLEVGVSGQTNRQYTTPLNTSERNFNTFVVGHDRAFDSEVKVLESIANRYKNNPNVKGQINLISERELCASCEGVVKQFNKAYPNIRINIIDGVKK